MPTNDTRYDESNRVDRRPMAQPDRFSMFITFTTLKEFADFCAVIRAADLDEETLKILAAKLSRSTHNLAAAERADTSGQIKE